MTLSPESSLAPPPVGWWEYPRIELSFQDDDCWTAYVTFREAAIEGTVSPYAQTPLLFDVGFDGRLVSIEILNMVSADVLKETLSMYGLAQGAAPLAPSEFAWTLAALEKAREALEKVA